MVIRWFIEKFKWKLMLPWLLFWKRDINRLRWYYFFLLIQSPNNELQNETNPTSVALFVWKWQPDEEQGVLENIAKFIDFGILPVFNISYTWDVAYSWLCNVQIKARKNRNQWAFWSYFHIPSSIYSCGNMSISPVIGTT